MTNIDSRASYTSADSIPLKTLLDQDIVNSVCNKKIIPPVHVQFSPTNKCNLNCSFCSCSERDKNLELSFEEIKFIVDTCHRLGTKAWTISGGGEPLKHPDFYKTTELINNKDMKIGLVSNGLMLTVNDPKYLTWCRISNDDSRCLGGSYVKKLSTVVSENNIDWAFSHVCSENPNMDEIARIVEFANKYNFTHIRLVSNLFHTEDTDMESIKTYLKINNIDDNLVIYQGRKNYEHGGDCFICYLKPFIMADGNIAACCGSQYSLDLPTYDFPKELIIGNVFDLESIINNTSSIPLDGSICKKCYYMNYNRILDSMLKELKHKEFV